MEIVLFMAILLYGVNVMSSVLEEKKDRIVEVLVSSVRPFQLMLGKVVGAGAVSFFQFVIWGVSARLLITLRSPSPVRSVRILLPRKPRPCRTSRLGPSPCFWRSSWAASSCNP